MRKIKNYKTRSTRKYEAKITKNNIIGFIFSLVILVPITLMIVVSIQASHRGSELQNIIDEARLVAQESKKVKSQIVKESSLSKLTITAQKLGFEKPEIQIYIQREKQVASLN